MPLLDQHRKEKQNLHHWYGELLTDENRALLRIDAQGHQITALSLRESQRDLESGRYTLAVCGQMNSGKSTLLNALIFGDEVLPSSPTTMTAKIARILHAAKPRIVVTFYTQREFDEVTSAARGDDLAMQELSDAREAFRDAGHTESSYLRATSRVDEVDGLEDLLQYVGVPDDGGIFSPYVKEVEIHAPIPWIEDVIVTDTPGTGDPNPERDKLTREYIRQADAVVYVTYAGQAGLTEQDVVFLDTNLLHIHPSKRLIAVNKCDSQPDVAAIRSHIGALRNSQDLRLQNLYQNEDQVLLVSGLGALASEMHQSGRPMSEELEEMLPILERSGFTDPAKHGVTELRTRIESTIIRSRGADILASHQRKISSTFDQAAIAYEMDLLQVQNALGDFGKSHEELLSEIESLWRSDDEIMQITLEIKAKGKQGFSRIMRNAKERLIKRRDEILISIDAELRSRMVRESSILADMQLMLLKHLGDHTGKFQEDLDRECRSVLASLLNDLQEKLTDSLRRAGVRSIKDGEIFLNIDLDQRVELLISGISNDAAKWQELCNLLTLILATEERTFWTDTLKKEESVLRTRAKDVLVKLLTDFTNALHENIRNDLSPLFEEKIADLQNTATIVVTMRRERLIKLEDRVERAEQERQRLMAEGKRLAEQIDKIKVLKETFARGKHPQRTSLSLPQ